MRATLRCLVPESQRAAWSTAPAVDANQMSFSRVFLQSTLPASILTASRQPSHCTLSCRNTANADWSVSQTGSNMDWLRTDLAVVLVHPQIAQNTGSIARTCAATAVPLHLIAPLGFEVSDRKLKRAGLDYWPYVCVRQHSSFTDFMEYYRQRSPPKRLVGFSKAATESYCTPGELGPLCLVVRARASVFSPLFLPFQGAIRKATSSALDQKVRGCRKR